MPGLGMSGVSAPDLMEMLGGSCRGRKDLVQMLAKGNKVSARSIVAEQDGRWTFWRRATFSDGRSDASKRRSKHINAVQKQGFDCTTKSGDSGSSA